MGLNMQAWTETGCWKLVGLNMTKHTFLPFFRPGLKKTLGADRMFLPACHTCDRRGQDYKGIRSSVAGDPATVPLTSPGLSQHISVVAVATQAKPAHLCSHCRHSGQAGASLYSHVLSSLGPSQHISVATVVTRTEPSWAESWQPAYMLAPYDYHIYNMKELCPLSLLPPPPSLSALI